MFLNEEGRILGKINIIDFCFILAVIAIGAATIYKFNGVGKGISTSKMETLQYVIEVEDVRDMTVEALNQSEVVYDSKINMNMGRIVNREKDPAMVKIVKTDGTVVKAERPERYTVRFTIQVPGIENEQGYYANGTYELKRDSKIQMKTKYCEFFGNVLDVTVIK